MHLANGSGVLVAPNGLVEYARRGRKLNGIYAPFWAFDAATRSEYTGQRGDYYLDAPRHRASE